MPLNPELVLFDCDGVLVDSETVTIKVMLDDLATRGLEVAPEDAHKLFVGGTIFTAGETAAQLGADIPDDWAETVYAKMYEELAIGVPLVNGVIELLDELDARGISTGVVSNGSARKMEITLGAHGLWDRFQGRIFSAHTLGVAKPDPEIIQIALRQFGVAPEKAVFVDDSPSGCKAGIAAGVSTIGFAEHSDARHLDDLCDHVADTMADVRRLVLG